MQILPELNKLQIHAVLSNAPDFDRWKTGLVSDDDKELELGLFLQLLYSQSVMAPFDWEAEFSGRGSHLVDASALATMTFDELRRVLIANVRLDRFSRGHLRNLAESGYLAQALARMEQLAP